MDQHNIFNAIWGRRLSPRLSVHAIEISRAKHLSAPRKNGNNPKSIFTISGQNIIKRVI